jgi:hypothetical protein
MTYTEGWPKKHRFGLGEGTIVKVVPLSDAERLREAIKDFLQFPNIDKLRAALDREGEDG